MTQELWIAAVLYTGIVFAGGFLSGHVIAVRNEKKYQKQVDDFYNMSMKDLEQNQAQSMEYTSRRKRNK